VYGKTGSRRIRLIASVPALQIWVEEHPHKNDPEAYLWCKIIPSLNNPKWKNTHLSYGFITRLLRVEVFKRNKVPFEVKILGIATCIQTSSVRRAARILSELHPVSKTLYGTG